MREGRQGWREEKGKRETKGVGVLAEVVVCSTAVCACVCVCVCVYVERDPRLKKCFQKHWWLCDKLLPHTHTNPEISMVHNKLPFVWICMCEYVLGQDVSIRFSITIPHDKIIH